MAVAVPIATCNMNNNCTLAVYTGFSGSDKHGTTLSTATQIHQINQYSASTLYYNIKNNVRSPPVAVQGRRQPPTITKRELVCVCSQVLPACLTTCLLLQVANILNNAQSGTLGGSTAPSSTTGGVA